MKTCPVCGAQALVEKSGSFIYTWSEGTEVATNTFDDATWEACEKCEEIILSPELQQRIEQQQYTNEGLLNPAEIKAIRQQLCLSQVAMADFISVGAKTYARWEAGLSMQNRSSDYLIRIAGDHPEWFLEMKAKQNMVDRRTVLDEWMTIIQSPRKQSEYGIAAHGEQPAPEKVEVIRRRLHEIARERCEAYNENDSVPHDN